MNITFLLRSLGMGGVNIVSSVLANKFFKDGHNVSCFAFYNGTGEVKEKFDKRIKIVIGNGFTFNKDNIALLRTLLIQNKTEVVINQWGLQQIPIETLLKAKKGLQVKIVSVYHNDPRRNGKIQDIENQISSASNIFKQTLYKIKGLVFKFVTAYCMRKVYNDSDYYGVLSPNYIANFKSFTKISNPKKIKVLPNPITIDVNGFEYNNTHKRKEILYVGRLDQTQKCVQRIIYAWSKLENKHSDWNLTIVGDGPDREKLENITSELKLLRVSFEGVQNPRPYYERASILLLTSDFEGFPLVLAEAMSFGVIPLVYGSFAAVNDVIQDNINGFITPKPYNVDDTVVRLCTIMNDETKRKQMANEAIKKSKDFSMDRIAEIWYALISQ